MSRIIIGGNAFEVEGSLSKINGKWYDGAGHEIDMNNLDGLKDAKTINITIEGDVERLEVDCCNTITVNGNVRKVNTGSGSITCKDIDGDALLVQGAYMQKISVVMRRLDQEAFEPIPSVERQRLVLATFMRTA